MGGKSSMRSFQALFDYQRVWENVWLKVETPAVLVPWFNRNTITPFNQSSDYSDEL
jgi:hypothetical protein